jgi:excisionase family DNA binding protein
MQNRRQDATLTARKTLTVQEAAQVYGCSVRTIRARIADGSLPAYRLGPRAIRIRVEDLDALMRRIPTAG